tara:strand:+ start:1914 stop:2816 length:903 start_codon:yes stop_codon:yes gene_type:complete
MENIISINEEQQIVKGFVLDLTKDQVSGHYRVIVRTENLDAISGDMIDVEEEHSELHPTYLEAYEAMRKLGDAIDCDEKTKLAPLYNDEVFESVKPFLPESCPASRYKYAGLAWLLKRVAGDRFNVFINQAYREAKVLAVLPPRGNKYGRLPRLLAEYSMPKGSTALYTIGCGKLSYGGLSKHKEWLHAIMMQTGYEGHTVTTKAEGRYGYKEREGTIRILPICGQGQGGATWCFPVNPVLYLGGNGTEGNQNRKPVYPVSHRKYNNIDYSNWGFDYNRVNWDSVSEESNPWVARAQDFS